MKKVLLIISLLIFVSVSVLGQNVISPTGKSCIVKITGKVESKKKYKAAGIGHIVGDIYNHDNQLSIRNGTPVELTITTKKAKGMGKPGYIEIKTVSTKDINGNVVPLNGIFYKEGENRKGAALGCGLGLGLTVLFPVGFFFFCIKGENVAISGTTIVDAIIL